METQESRTIPDPEAPQNWAQGRWDDSIRLRQADRAIAMERHLRKERLLRRLAKKTMDGTVGQRTVEPEDGDTDMIVLGNYSVTIGSEQPTQSAPQQPIPVQTRPQESVQPVSQPNPATQQPAQEPVRQAPAAKTTWQKLWPWLLAAAVPASGAGGAAVANYMSKPTSMTDTWVEWDFKATPPTDTQK